MNQRISLKLTSAWIACSLAIRRMAAAEDGQDLVEYAMIVAAVALALITVVNQLSGAIVSLYSSITERISGDALRNPEWER